MKFIFLFVSIACALAFSALSVIVATGKIPFTEPEEQMGAMRQKTPLTVFSGQKEVIDVLIEDLKSKQEAYEKKMTDLSTKEEELLQQREIINGLKVEMELLQSGFDTAVVELKTSEVANFKHLADVFSKMDSAGASSLLQRMELKRAATIFSMIGDRQAAAILNAAVETDEGAQAAAEWSDLIRRMERKTKGR